MRNIRVPLVFFCFLFLPFKAFGAPPNWLAVITGETDGASGIVDILRIPANTLKPTIFIPEIAALHVSIEPNAKIAYVADGQTGGKIYPINLITNTVGMPITLSETAIIFSMGITPDGKRLLVGTTVPSLVSIDLQTLVQTEITAGITSIPVDLAITPDGKKVYVVDSDTDSVIIIDLTTNTVDPDSPIQLTENSTIYKIGITPNGKTALVVEVVSASVAVIDLTTNTLVSEIPMALPATSFPVPIAITPDGKQAWVGVFDVFDPDYIVPFEINGFTLTEKPFISLAPDGDSLFDLAFTPDGESAYVTMNDTNNIMQISGVKTNTPVITFDQFLPQNSRAYNLLITPDQAPTASFIHSVPHKLHPPILIRFDASASSSPIGDIVSYQWDFGDGSPTVTTTNPKISHTYTKGGVYTATLTVTNTAGTSTKQTFTGRVVSNNGSSKATQQQLLGIPDIFPPTNFRVKQIEDRSSMQTDLINVLKWEAPLRGEVPVSYGIYRDSTLKELVGIVSGTPQFNGHSAGLFCLDHNRHPDTGYTYFIVSIDASGFVSKPVSITVSP